MLHVAKDFVMFVADFISRIGENIAKNKKHIKIKLKIQIWYKTNNKHCPWKKILLCKVIKRC